MIQSSLMVELLHRLCSSILRVHVSGIRILCVGVFRIRRRMGK